MLYGAQKAGDRDTTWLRTEDDMILKLNQG
jgi:hypothetical protein